MVTISSPNLIDIQQRAVQNSAKNIHQSVLDIRLYSDFRLDVLGIHSQCNYMCFYKNSSHASLRFATISIRCNLIACHP